MNMINPPEETAAAEIAAWPDSGGIAEISWHSSSGQTFRQEIGGKQDALHLLQVIADDDNLTLVSAQLRRSGAGQSGS
jgi:hypothetical protein